MNVTSGRWTTKSKEMTLKIRLNISSCAVAENESYSFETTSSFQLLYYWFGSTFMLLSLGSVRLFCYYYWEKIILLFIKDALDWSKVTVKTIMLPNISIANKCCSFELYIYERIPKNTMYHSFNKVLKKIVFNIDNNNKCVLILRKSALLLRFLKIMWHWRLQ